MTIEKALVAKKAWHFPRANAENATIETDEKGITIRGGTGQYICLSTADLISILRLVDEVHGLTKKTIRNRDKSKHHFGNIAGRQPFALAAVGIWA